MTTPNINSDPYCIIKAMIIRSENLIQQFSIQEFELIVQWLKDNMKDYPCLDLVLCHGDYNPKNILVNINDELVTIDLSNVDPGYRRTDFVFTIAIMSSETDFNIEKLLLESYEQPPGIKISGIDYFKVITNVFNFIRIYRAAVNYSITQETDDSKKVFLTEYRPYCKSVLTLMYHELNVSFPTIEKFLLQY